MGDTIAISYTESAANIFYNNFYEVILMALCLIVYTIKIIFFKMDQNTKKQRVAEAVLDYIDNGESLGIDLDRRSTFS